MNLESLSFLKLWLRSLAVAGLCLIATLALAVPAHADFITSNGDIQMMDSEFAAYVQPPLVDIKLLSLSGGRVYTNQVDGDPFAVGSTVRTVGVVRVADAFNGEQSPALLPDRTGLLFIFAVEGKIVKNEDGIVSAQFDIGRIALASDRTGNLFTYSRDSAKTWNFDNRFAEFELLPQMDIIPGPHGLGVFTPADQTNVSAVNTEIEAGAQGVFLFTEDSTPDQNAGILLFNPGLGTFTGDNWLRNVDGAGGGSNDNEGLAAFTNQTALVSFITPSAADLVELDKIGVWAGFTGSFSAGYTPTAFGVGTGDFVADLSANAYIGYVPEPSSLLIFAVGGGIVAVYARRRGRKVTAGNA